MVKLGVNIDHVATVRQARLSKEPDPVRCAVLVELAGADGITIHLREDRRHIQERDLMLLKSTIKTRLNLEMACSKEIIDIALKHKPDMCTLVPEKREELTTEGGLDVASNIEFYKKAIDKLKNKGIRVSAFIDADRKQIDASHKAGSEVIEIHTGHFADAAWEQRQIEFKRIVEAANYAKDLGLLVSAGHGLDYQNIKEILNIKFLYEVNIGHSIIARSIYVGIYDAVKTMRELIEKYL